MKLQRPQFEPVQKPATAEVAAVRQEPSEIKFDPRVEITEIEKQKIVDRLLELRAAMNADGGGRGGGHERSFRSPERLPGRQERFNRDKLAEYIEMAVPFITMFPELRTQIGLDDDVFEQLKENVKESDGWGDASAYLLRADYLLRLFPERRADLDIDSRFEEFQGEVAYSVDHHGVQEYLRRALHMLFLFPERRDELDLDGRYEEIIAGIKWFTGTNAPASMREMLALSLMYPNRRREFITAGVVDHVYRPLQQWRTDENWDEVVGMSYCLTAATANQVRIVNGAMEVQNNRAVHSVSALPDRNIT